MIQELIKACMLIFIAEMGDKTQILAMAFATRFPVKKVLLGIFLGSLMNHGLAVILGSYISNFIPINTIQIIAGFAFVFFALWTLKPEDEEEEDAVQKSKFGPVVTVALAFFIGELGDKTQLTAITLATDAAYPIAILGGTVLGMILTGGIGIIVGKKIGDRIPEFAIKIIAASVFMFFGVTKLYQTVPSQYLSLPNVLIFIAAIAVAVYLLLRPTIIKRRQDSESERESEFKRKSNELYNYYHQVEENLDKICLGEEACVECQGGNCIVGNTKALIKNGLNESEPVKQEISANQEGILQKNYDRDKVIDSLRMTLEIMKGDTCCREYANLNAIRRNLEIMLFGRSFVKINNWADYAKHLTAMDETIAISLLEDIEE